MAAAESLAFFEGEELIFLFTLMGARIPVEVGSDIVALKASDLCPSWDPKERHLRKLISARMSLLHIKCRTARLCRLDRSSRFCLMGVLRLLCPVNADQPLASHWRTPVSSLALWQVSRRF